MARVNVGEIVSWAETEVDVVGGVVTCIGAQAVNATARPRTHLPVLWKNLRVMLFSFFTSLIV